MFRRIKEWLTTGSTEQVHERKLVFIGGIFQILSVIVGAALSLVFAYILLTTEQDKIDVNRESDREKTESFQSALADKERDSEICHLRYNQVSEAYATIIGNMSADSYFLEHPAPTQTLKAASLIVRHGDEGESNYMKELIDFTLELVDSKGKDNHKSYLNDFYKHKRPEVLELSNERRNKCED